MRLPRDSDAPPSDPSQAIALARTDEVNVGLMVRHAFRSFQRRLQELVVPFGLSTAEFRVLRALETGGALTQVQIAARAGMDRPYAALIVKQLREKRLVDAQPDPNDGRRVLLTLTAEGETAAGTIAGQLAEVNSAVIADVKPDDLAIFCDVMAKIRSNLDHRGAQSAAGPLRRS